MLIDQLSIRKTQVWYVGLGVIALIVGAVVFSIDDSSPMVNASTTEVKTISLILGEHYLISADYLVYSGWDGSVSNLYRLTVVDDMGYGAASYQIYVWHGAIFEFRGRTFEVVSVTRSHITLEES